MPHESISVFDMFKIGIGPSSSHTLGPWRAALACLESIREKTELHKVEHVRVLLYGSLAKTGKGHGTDIAVMMGLIGEDPVTVAVNSITPKINRIQEQKKLSLGGLYSIPFDPASDLLLLHQETLAYHPNGISFLIQLKEGGLPGVKHIFRSVGDLSSKKMETPVRNLRLIFPFRSILRRICCIGVCRDFPFTKL